jgi:hypothetical protein
VFLWVDLVVQMLRKSEDDGETIARKRERLAAIASGLDELFTQILLKLTEFERRETFHVMKWVAFAQRRLTPMELCFALTFDDGNHYCSLQAW